MVDHRRSERPHQPRCTIDSRLRPEDAVITGELASPPTPPFRSERSILSDTPADASTEDDAERRVAAYVAPSSPPGIIGRLTSWLAGSRASVAWSGIVGKSLAIAVAALLIVSLGRMMSDTGGELPTGAASSPAPLGPESGGTGINSGSESGRGGSSGAARTTGQIDGDEDGSPTGTRAATLDSDLLVGSNVNPDADPDSDSAGSNSAGSNSADSNSADSNSAGSNSAGSNSAGSNSAGSSVGTSTR